MKSPTDRERLASAMAADVNTVSPDELKAASSILDRTVRDIRQGQCPCGVAVAVSTTYGLCVACLEGRIYGLGIKLDDAIGQSLIRAAPELLTACRAAIPWLGVLIAKGAHLQTALPNYAETVLRQLEEAVAKADGGAQREGTLSAQKLLDENARRILGIRDRPKGGA